MIPASTLSIQVTLSDGGAYSVVNTVNRPSDQSTSTMSFTDVPVGAITLSASAYPQAGAGGRPLASTLNQSLTAQAGTANTFNVTLDSVITSLNVTAPRTYVWVGETMAITMSAWDSSHQAVLVAPQEVIWSSSDTAIATVDPQTGIITGVSDGTVTITANETCSRKTSNITMTVRTESPIGTVQVNPIDNATMVYVPHGPFLMGSTSEDAYAELFDEAPQHTVILDGYWIYKYEVTVAQFRAFCTATGYTYDWTGNKPPWGWIDSHPVVNVNWADARAYAAWAGAIIPTEAQWEKAARGTDGRFYPWGRVWDCEKCNDWDDHNPLGGGYHASRTAPTGSYPDCVSPYGAYDQSGNVWEWCADWYGKTYFSVSPLLNPTGPTSGPGRVARGGGWADIDYPLYCRITNRYYYVPTTMLRWLGFRCAMPVTVP